MNKFLSLINVFYGLIAFLLIFTSSSDASFLSHFAYIVLYGGLPIVLSYLLWQHNRWSLYLSAAFYLSQSIKSLNSSPWLPYYPPISFGVPIGSFSENNAYLLDMFSISMLLAITIAAVFNQSHNNHAHH